MAQLLGVNAQARNVPRVQSHPDSRSRDQEWTQVSSKRMANRPRPEPSHAIKPPQRDAGVTITKAEAMKRVTRFKTGFLNASKAVYRLHDQREAVAASQRTHALAEAVDTTVVGEATALFDTRRQASLVLMNQALRREKLKHERSLRWLAKACPEVQAVVMDILDNGISNNPSGVVPTQEGLPPPVTSVHIPVDTSTSASAEASSL